MRTTISVDERLLGRAKRFAARHGKTLSSLVEEALRAELGRRGTSGSEPFRLVTFRGSGTRPGVDLDKTSVLLVAEDEARWSSARRKPRRRT